MRQRRVLFAAVLFTMATMLSGISKPLHAQDNCVSRIPLRGHGRGFWFAGRDGHHAGHLTGLFKKDPYTPQPQRFYDSTGRWTGDGVDSMATLPRAR